MICVVRPAAGDWQFLGMFVCFLMTPSTQHIPSGSERIQNGDIHMVDHVICGVSDRIGQLTPC